MEKLLILGVNTRPLVNSALKLNYKVYSGSYFKTYDFKEPYMEKHILNQQANKSSGYFEDNYSYEKILELYEDDVYNEVDNIILYTGISPNNIPNYLRKKILGNKYTKDFENKYKFYKKIKKIKKSLEIKQPKNQNNENIKFCIPKTFKANDIHEAFEIANQHNCIEFITKPIEGSGGYGVNYLNTLTSIRVNNSDNISGFETKFENPFILQEYIKGINVSSSVLSTGKVAKTIFSSYNNANNNFIYNGNITPYDNINISTELASICENIISKFNLIGSNGIDMIIEDNTNNNNCNTNTNTANNSEKENIYIIEVNPRIQGSYECGEKVLGINMLEGHIKACNGEIIPFNPPNGTSIKEIVYSNSRIKIDSTISNIADINNTNNIINDIPYPNTIIEKNQPVATIISYENTLKKSENIIKLAKKEINRYIQNIE